MHISFHDDHNIVYVYNEVIKTLQQYIDQKELYISAYEQQKALLQNSPSPEARMKAASIVKEGTFLMPMILDDTLIAKYKDRVGETLREYRKLCMGTKMFGVDQCTDIPRRVGIISRFLHLTRGYIPITWECTYNMDMICPRCFSQLKRYGHVVKCIKCSFSQTRETHYGHHSIDSVSKTDGSYDATKNFRKEYAHLCGIVNEIKLGQVDQIRSYLTRACIKEPTRSHIRDGFKNCGYANYHDVNAVYSEISGEPLPSVTEHIEACADMFQQYSKTFHSLDSKEGSNITNIHFLIRLFLWRLKVPYQEDWFRPLSRETEEKHKRNARKVCSILQWDTPPEWNK